MAAEKEKLLEDERERIKAEYEKAQEEALAAADIVLQNKLLMEAQQKKEFEAKQIADTLRMEEIYPTADVVKGIDVSPRAKKYDYSRNKVDFIPEMRLAGSPYQPVLQLAQQGRPVALAPRPKTRLCHVCGRQYGTHSFDIHLRQCKELWVAREELKDKWERKPLPSDPCPPEGSENDLEVLNKLASEMFDKVSLSTCAHCGRTFLLERLVLHNTSCTFDNPGRRVNPMIKFRIAEIEAKDRERRELEEKRLAERKPRPQWGKRVRSLPPLPVPDVDRGRRLSEIEIPTASCSSSASSSISSSVHGHGSGSVESVRSPRYLRSTKSSANNSGKEPIDVIPDAPQLNEIEVTQRIKSVYPVRIESRRNSVESNPNVEAIDYDTQTTDVSDAEQVEVESTIIVIDKIMDLPEMGSIKQVNINVKANSAWGYPVKPSLHIDTRAPDRVPVSASQPVLQQSQQAQQSRPASISPPPKTRLCHVCGRQYGQHSFDIHLKQCKELWVAREELKDKWERKPLPSDPCPPEGSENDLEVLNKLASEIVDKVMLSTCAYCGRTFLLERLLLHNTSCTFDNPYRRVNTIIEPTAEEIEAKDRERREIERRIAERKPRPQWGKRVKSLPLSGTDVDRGRRLSEIETPSTSSASSCTSSASSSISSSNHGHASGSGSGSNVLNGEDARSPRYLRNTKSKAGDTWRESQVER